MKTLGIIFGNLHDKDIGELTAVRSLASVPFGGRFRLIDFVLSNMVNSGISKVGVITKNNYQSLMDHVGSGKHWDLSRKNGGLIILPPYGGGDKDLYSHRLGAIKNIEPFIRHCDEDYVVFSDCDNVCNINLSNVIASHIDNHADITLVTRKKNLTNKKPRTIVDVNGDGKVVGVINTSKASGENIVFANIFVTNRKFLLNMLDTSTELGYASFTNDILAKGCNQYNIYAYMQDGYFANIDSLSNYYKHSLELLNKDIRDELFYRDGANIYTKVRDSAPARVGSAAVIHNSLIADGCDIQGEVSNSILFRGVKIAKGAKITNSIIFQDAVIGENSSLNCVVADKLVTVLDGRTLSGHETHPYFISKHAVI
ncbi:MAG: glucose-1-phosphate adenylyltransferase subunit GlgD [Clostridiales bacterium]|nr:glucose-1-phosphate adenylyltransferase subunit GlgD [Clostridiales bacterium]